ncbi:MAG: hypothetical protein ACW99G_10285 [Candidatus Thorarchaeota archaeon]|jgi:hypothetical protein
MDMAAIRARLAGLANKTQKRRDLWKPKDKHEIRCLPYPHGDEPIVELGFHYNLGATRSLLCPKHNYGKECAVCDFCDKLRSWNDVDGTEKPVDLRQADFEIFKNIQLKERWYIPMIDRADETPNPLFYAFSKTIFEKFLNMCLNEEMHEIAGTTGTDVLTSTESAFDLTIDFKKPNNEDKKGNTKTFPVTDVDKKMRPSKLAKTKKEVEEILAKIPNIGDVYPEVSSAEAERVFMEFVNAGGGEPDVKDSGVEYKANTAEAPVVGGQSIDDAFADLAG